MSGLDREPDRGGMEFGGGCRREAFLEWKLARRREGMPAWSLNSWLMYFWRGSGRFSVLGRMRRMSQLLYLSG